MRPLQAHCHLGLGTLYATTDQRQRARAALSTATGMYRAMAMILWLPQAEAALAQTGEAAPPVVLRQGNFLLLANKPAVNLRDSLGIA